MKYNQYLTPFFMITLLFLVSCHGTVSRNIMPCTVGLTLKPGENCRYTDSNKDFSFDFIFSAIKGGASFPYLDLKSPSGTFGPASGPIATTGGTTVDDYGVWKINIDPTVAQLCSGRSDFEIRSKSGSVVRLPGRGLGQKCFSASKNSDGSWTIQQIPLP